MRFTMFKTQPRELASSTAWVSSSLGIKGHALRNLSGSLYEHEIAAVQLKFRRERGEGGGGVEGGRQEKNKIYFFYHFWFMYQLIYLLPYLRVIFSVVKANMEEMVKALYLPLKTFLFFPKKLYLKIEVVLERTKMEKFPV